MSKLLQVTGKKTDFKNGVVDLDLLQTNYDSFTPLMTSVPGQTVSNVVAGDQVGFQFFHDMINRQQALIPGFTNYKNDYNNHINAKKLKVTNLNNFVYNFNSLVNYSGNFYAGQRLDYKTFSMLIAAEKEAYDFTVYSRVHIAENSRLLGIWSRTKFYGSNLHGVTSREIETNGTHDWGWSIHTHSKYCTTGIFDNGIRDKKRCIFTNCHLIPVGYTDWCILQIGGDCLLKCTITRHALGVAPDDGYFRQTAGTMIKFEKLQGDAIRRYNDIEYIHNLRSAVSPHFSDPTGNYKLSFFKNRVLI